jgi:hypothetical protein
VATPEGLLSRRTPWSARLLPWADVEKVELRDLNGWNYAALSGRGIGPFFLVPLDVEDPDAFAAAVEREAPPGHVLAGFLRNFADSVRATQ